MFERQQQQRVKKEKRRGKFLWLNIECMNMLRKEESSRRDGHKGVSFLA
jgi:hypothetical protein